MLKLLTRMFVCKTGVTAVEYALIAAFIAVAMTVGVDLVSPSLFATFRAAAEAAPID